MLQPNRKLWGSKYHLSMAFLNELPSGGLASSTSKKKAPSKRKPAGGDSDDDGGKTKRAKPQVTALSDEEWKIMAQNGTLETQTIPNLKDYLKRHGLPLSGKKADLVERVYDALSS
mmetsp:Transcript_33890/g.43704  ORF Transcript_33890/g.43704 Transcript_33890/m.43704 type:complete len:116 (+) Transcript_33890:369-716(+)